MPQIIVSDASCLILYSKIGEFELLKNIFKKITITEIVSKEFNEPLPDWIQICNPTGNLHFQLRNLLDFGEATSISLAAEYKDSL